MPNLNIQKGSQMGKIVILDEHTINKIAAGEVVERPASIVKELCENSIDAGATSITVEIKNGGIAYIKITDNGSGIKRDDVEIAFEKHSTSKIRNAEDLNTVLTMGFRGEALASIAAVSKLKLVTRTAEDMEGSQIYVEGGSIGEIQDVGCPVGTSITVEELFFNTPARYKFLKKDYTEAGYIEDVVSRLALGYPAISFRLFNSGALVIQTPGNNDLVSAAYSIYGAIAKSTVKVDYSDGSIEVKGIVGKPDVTRANRNNQIYFINNRYIKNKTINSALEESYKTLIPAGRYPFAVLNLKIDPFQVDVNVHPTKQEVRFSDEGIVFRAIYHAVKNALFSGEDLVREISVGGNKNTAEQKGFRMKDVGAKAEYIQQPMPEMTKSNNISIFNLGLDKPNSGNNFTKSFNTLQVHNKYETKPVTTTQNEKLEVKEKNETYSLPQEIEERKLLDFRVIGTAFATYIIVEFNNELYIIDQHAAHERVMYEKLKKEWQDGTGLSQMLLVPEIVELTHKDMCIIERNKELLTNIGFIIEPFGNNSIKINSAPVLFEKGIIKDIFLDVIDGISDISKTKGKDQEPSLLYRIACKAAVKANKSLSESEIVGLLESMSSLENPFSCPHGRPTSIKMTKTEIEKKFGRL